MKELNIISKNEPIFWIGDKFYRVEPNGRKYHNSHCEFTSTCPSCDGTRRIKYTGCDGNEYEADCPLCKSSSSYSGFSRDRIRMAEWTVREYIVYKVKAEGPTAMSAYKDGKGYTDHMSLTAFSKYGRGSDDYVETDVPMWSSRIDPEFDKLNLPEIAERESCDYVFRSRSYAEELCALLKECDKARLEEFNKTFHTDHVYPFE